MNRDNTEQETLAQQLLTALSGERLGFHMPGHVAGRGLPFWLMAELGRLDTTELPHTDNLSHPTGMLQQAQVRAARTFGAGRTHFLVNGATGGLLAAVHALAGPGDTMLVGRDCHRSVLQAVRLAGATAVFVTGSTPGAMPGTSSGTMPGTPPGTMALPCGPSETDWLQAIFAHPEAKALLLTRPNYYGTAVSLCRIVQEAHDAGMSVLVDEAHGAHFGACAAFPATALSCGADLVVQSLHKTLPAPTQTALLHESASWAGVRSGLPVATVDEAVAVFQTTSPSWMLLSMMDAAIGWLSGTGMQMYTSLLKRLETFKVPESVAHAVKRLSLADVAEGFALDPTRLVLRMPQAGTSLAEALWEHHGIAVEMADLDHVVLIVTPFHTSADLRCLEEALLDVVPVIIRKQGEQKQAFVPSQMEDIGAPAFSEPSVRTASADLHQTYRMDFGLSEARQQPRTWVPLALAAGRVAATAIVPYPPGIAVLLPGECFDGRILSYIGQLLAAGVVVHGVENGQVQVV